MPRSTPAPVDEWRAALEARHPAWEPRTLDQALDAVAAEHRERPFVLDDEAAHRYRDVAAWSERLARGLVAGGVEPGGRVALLLPNGAPFVAAVFAIARAGAVAVPLNVRLAPRELDEALRASGATVLLTVAGFRDADIAGALDAIDARARAAVVLCEEGRFADLERGPDAALDGELARRRAAADPAAPATIFFTSGTTGHPKGVVLTHDMELRSAYGSAYTRAFEDGRRILFALPLHHVFAYVEGMLAVLFAGGAIVPQAAFDPVETLRGIERHAVHEALFVPTMTLAVVEAARAGDYELGALHAVMSAAATCPARLWREVVELLGVRELVTGYGMTETAAATTFTLPHDDLELLVETVGRPKLGGVAATAPDGTLAAYRTIDPDTGAELPDGATGELVVEGPIVTRGYHEDAEATAAAFDARGRLRSGDLGRVRADGYLELEGRSKDLYKCGGEQVAPAEVEAVITALPDVEQAYVVPLPDELMGEVGCAFVVPAAGAAPEAAAILEHCRAQLSRFKVPVAVLLCEAADLPLTASGKVQRFVLAERAAAQAPRGGGGARVPA